MRRAGLWILLAGIVAGFSPFRAEQPDVRAGNERVAAGRPQEALPRYDAAERATGPRAEIEYDRGVALYRLGKHAEARDAFRRALDQGAGALSSRAHQNMGNALSAAGDDDGAIAAFREALREDPKNDDARFDLEVLLRRKQQDRKQDRKDQQQEQKQDQQQDRKQEQKDQQQQAGKQEQEQERAQAAPQPEKPPQAEQSRRPAPPAPQADSAEPEGSRPEAEERGEPAAADPDRLSREDAARILDAFRAREKAMPLGRDERRRTRRADADRDW